MLCARPAQVPATEARFVRPPGDATARTRHHGPCFVSPRAWRTGIHEEALIRSTATRTTPVPSWGVAVSRVLFCLGHLLGAPVYLGNEWLATVVSQRRPSHGIPVYVLLREDAHDLFFALDRALSLIERLDPRRYRRIRQDVRRVVVVQRHSDFTSPHSGTVGLAVKSIVGQKDASVALSLVHEAVHARLHRAGLRYWPDWQQRIEELCIQQQIAFVRLLPLAGYALPVDWLQPWEQLLATYPRTKGGRLYRWLSRRFESHRHGEVGERAA